MQRKQHHIEFVAQYILNDKTVVEVTDESTEVIHKTQTQSPNHGGRPGVDDEVSGQPIPEQSFTSTSQIVITDLILKLNEPPLVNRAGEIGLDEINITCNPVRKEK